MYCNCKLFFQCQWVIQRLALADFESASNFFWDNHTPKVVDSSPLSSCGARLCAHSYRGAIVDRGASLRSLLLTPWALATSPVAFIYSFLLKLQIVILLFVIKGNLYCHIYFLTIVWYNNSKFGCEEFGMLEENAELSNDAKLQKFKKYAWLVLLSFGFMYLFFYNGRQNKILEIFNRKLP